ncbi:precorrin-3B synthase [Gordonia sp. PKS22-38]|uniref:Precorrin-3B synthase n=1 Tax=Gordonia prachuapensis TaxID=3115651 RepID=A0ABU7MZE9_9ACTN|nr:precorrin-3B synthase [Gordonia sp. PKS22-38]
MTQPTHRDVADRCPGVFSTHAAADGAVARVRLPGGRIQPGQLEILAQAAAAHGDGFLEPTARGNLQLRGISDVAAVAQAVIDAGLAPSKTHDTVRNIEVSPLTGRIGGAADVWPVADALDAGLRADDRSTALSGRFLLGVDDGRGDIVRRRPDACALARREAPDAAKDAVGATGIVADIMVDGELLGSATGVDGIVAALLDVAHDFTAVAPQAWRVGDLTAEQRDSLVSGVRARLAPAIGGATSTDATDAADPIVGWFDQDDGAVLLGAVVELGRLPARLAEFLAAVGKPLIFTPDREILLCDLDEGVAETVVRVLAPMGLIFDASSPWARVSCCVGAPGCSKAAAPVRDDLLERVRAGESVEDREHWVGCGRRCGSPAGPHLLVEATPDDGYRTHRR